MGSCPLAIAADTAPGSTSRERHGHERRAHAVRLHPSVADSRLEAPIGRLQARGVDVCNGRCAGSRAAAVGAGVGWRLEPRAPRPRVRRERRRENFAARLPGRSRYAGADSAAATPDRRADLHRPHQPDARPQRRRRIEVQGPRTRWEGVVGPRRLRSDGHPALRHADRPRASTGTSTGTVSG